MTRHRPVKGDRGYIVRVNQAGVIDGYPADYKTQTVFACSALLPIIVTDRDASLGLTFMRRLCPSGCDTRYDETYSTWSQLHFQAGERDREGVSYANAYSSGGPFAAGQDASWISSLVPAVHRNTKPSAGSSRGLAGELPIIIALMGFHGRPSRASDVFLNHSWHMNRWCGPARASNHRSYTPTVQPSARWLTECSPKIKRHPSRSASPRVRRQPGGRTTRR